MPLAGDFQNETLAYSLANRLVWVFDAEAGGKFNGSSELVSQYVYTQSDDIRHNLVQAAGLRVHPRPDVTH